MLAVSLATEPLGFFGALIVIIIALMFFGVAIAVTLGPIALVIAAIVRALRNSAATNSAGTHAPGTNAPGMSITMSAGTRVVALDQVSSFGQAFSASLQRGLGGQLGQTVAQMMALAAAQHPLELQLAPMVMAIEAARRQGDVAPVRPFLTDRFAARFTASAVPVVGQGAISHMVLGDDAVDHDGRLVIRVDRGTAGTEFWTFQRDTSAVPDGTPIACPKCGAPTAGDRGGTCRFCGAVFSTTAPVLPGPVRWLLDDISVAPPALAA
jgi:hypothetical protein